MAFRLCVLAISFFAAEASLRGKIQAHSGTMSAEQLRETVLQEVMAALGSGHRVTEQRLAVIEDALRPTFQAMPKNAQGKLEDAAARYVLHRLFVQRHAMYIKGLEASGMSWNNMSTAEVLEDHIPSFVLSLFEDRLKGEGLGLHELTVLAATLEHLIHDEAVARLGVVYEAHGTSKEQRVDEVALQELIDTYMTIFLVGAQNANATSVAQERSNVVDSYPGWKDTQKFTMQVVSSVSQAKMTEPDFAMGNFTFRAATQIVEEIGERYGRWQDSECRDLKGLLSKHENAGTGRVLLKDFYGAALKGNWQFSESVAYLRELGALDESDPANLAVLIPNYVNSQSNCVASSSIYSVCCINECEALMGHLERQVAAPEASPGQLLQLVAHLPSNTQKAPRTLPASLGERLQQVATHHGGMVPLHGRLFAQWLHHAYPRECPYPHLAGKTNPMTADEWMQVKGQSVSATKDEMKRVIAQAVAQPKEQELPWVHQEELVAESETKKSGGGFFGFVRQALFVFAAVGACGALASKALATLSSGHRELLPSVHKQHMC
ncbi:unnamed protein product [Effrenium voratum]|uniref:Uncharacterized protein n=1 Tax=Effrenium voratum TaxID=2562239 RepID=A0AA36JBR7_9DINO|nr:unnamed protein product [Effrenium voratum]|eukprot:CAMPEP_0181461946 /NCGR_PEP_ID=MMETSP1110-20121109/34140_1 /TAXON_ID=174948 /ORGANISM="Symbiodinium sp., Strain CCMP421" /LENGTH=550 /DNA_ID=CAMNT_0023586587 /DNA_START=83 /DNA_END=1735 /DNA_ORIENTATION=-